MFKLETGEQFELNVDVSDPERIRHQIITHGGDQVLDAVQGDQYAVRVIRTHLDFMSNTPAAAYLHSALCALSLPQQRPEDEFAPIVRRDDKLTLMISPQSTINADQEEEKVGVPYGNIARLILIHIISEAVRNESRDVYVGKSITGFMKRLGYKSFGGGPRGTATLFKEQLKRLNSCQWTIRFSRDAEDQPDRLSRVNLTDDQLLWTSNGEETCEVIRLSERFFEHTMQNRVMFDEAALSSIKHDATMLDLYMYLAYRLPRIPIDQPVHLSWHQLQNHLGSGLANIRHFRAAVRQKIPHVLAVYPGARVDIDNAKGVRLYAAPPALTPQRRSLTSR